MRVLRQFLYRHHPALMVRVWRRQQHPYAAQTQAATAAAQVVLQATLIVRAEAARIRDDERMRGITNAEMDWWDG